jgi:hypothetical protein
MRTSSGLTTAPMDADPLNARYASGGYEAWPRPNSNTFVRELTQRLPELAFVFDHNAVGKDYAWFDAGLTPSRTGVHFDSWPFGATVAMEEGLELHLLQLTFRLRLWPPRVELPFLPPIPWERAPEPEAPAPGGYLLLTAHQESQMGDISLLVERFEAVSRRVEREPRRPPGDSGRGEALTHRAAFRERRAAQ